MNISIRNECENDYSSVEQLTREAFWNLYVPGCNEHYLVHVMRKHPDFISNLDFVAVSDDKIVGNIMYAKSYIVDELHNRIETISFGPLSVLPPYQKQGVGSALLRHSLKTASELNYKVIIIYGHPHNYCKHGFRSSKDFGVSDVEGKYPYGLLVYELEKGILQGHTWKYYPSGVYEIAPAAAEEFDKQFDFKEKKYTYTQEEFSIACRAYLI